MARPVEAGGRTKVSHNREVPEAKGAVRNPNLTTKGTELSLRTEPTRRAYPWQLLNPDFMKPRARTSLNNPCWVDMLPRHGDPWF